MFAATALFHSAGQLLICAVYDWFSELESGFE